ncbi:MAG: hypothetical protein H6Q06_343, partial [Acidobacteria bacterium]|nr:hypothetical protein [Acidobacteriota bacterium]
MRSQHRFWFFVMLLLLPALASWGKDADLILHNGRIVTVDAGFTVRQAV